uniref:IS110 family transposase n=1 Tax=Nocardia takedensis TaxID=259390 RepID=UPI0035714231
MDTSIPERPIFVGVDTHADTHHVAVVNEHGKKLTDREFPTTATGYAQIEQWLQTI